MDFLCEFAGGLCDEAATATDVGNGVLISYLELSADFFPVSVSAFADFIESFFGVFTKVCTDACGHDVAEAFHVMPIP